MNVNPQIKRLGKDTLLYGISSTIQAVISFVLFPIFTRVFTKAEIGIQDIINSAIAIIVVIFTFGLDSAVSRLYFDANSEKEKASFVSTWFWLTVIVGSVLVLSYFIFGSNIDSAFLSVPNGYTYFALSLLIVFFTLLSNITLMVLRLNFQPLRYASISIASILVQSVLSIILIVVCRLGIMGYLFGTLAGMISRLLLSFIYAKKYIKLSFSTSVLGKMLKYGLPLVPASLSLWLLNFSNRYFLLEKTGIEQVGNFSVANKIASVATFIISAFQIGWGPFAFSLINDVEIAKTTYASVLSIFVVITMIIITAVSIFSREMILVFATREYLSASTIVPILCSSAIAWGMLYIVGMGYQISKKSYHTTIATIAGAFVTIIGNIILVPSLNIVGAAVASLAGNIVTLGYAFFWGQYYFSVQYDYKKIVTTIILSFSVIIIGIVCDNLINIDFIIRGFLKALVFFIYIYVLSKIKILRLSEIIKYFKRVT